MPTPTMLTKSALTLVFVDSCSCEFNIAIDGAEPVYLEKESEALDYILSVINKSRRENKKYWYANVHIRGRHVSFVVIRE